MIESIDGCHTLLAKMVAVNSLFVWSPEWLGCGDLSEGEVVDPSCPRDLELIGTGFLVLIAWSSS